MTCIVGVEFPGGVVLGADSCGAAGGRTTRREDPKLFTVRPEGRREEWMIAYTSSFRMGQLLRWRLDPPHAGAGTEDLAYMQGPFVDAVRKALRDGGWLKKSDDREEGGHFLCAWRGRLYHVEGDLQVGRYREGYSACGSGVEVALGSLHTTHGYSVDTGSSDEERARGMVRAALTAAEAHNAYVARPFTIRTQLRPDGGGGEEAGE